MNLKEIRTAFVKKNGRYDLVVDTTDYVDNGANFYIQAGQRLLDSIAPYRKSIGRYAKDIVSGEGSMVLEQIRFIDSVWIKSSGDSRGWLDRKAYSWLKSEYGEDAGEKAKGTATFSGVTSEDDTITIDDETYTFKEDPSGSTQVDIGATISATIANLVTAINTYSSVAKAYQLSATTCLIEYYLVGTAGNSITFSASSSSISLNGSGTLGSTVSGRANDIDTGEPLYFAPLISNPHPDLSVSNLPEEETSDLLFGYDRFAYDGILWRPPADGNYVVTVFGGFYSVLSSDTDVSYHSETYPELLLIASNLAIEIFYRNTQGFNDWYTSLKRLISDTIDKDLIMSEMILAGNQMKG